VTESQRALEEDAAVPGRSRWLPPGVSEPPPVVPTPPPTRSNRFQPTNDAPEYAQQGEDALTDRVRRLESRLDAQVEATQRAFGRSLHALIQVVDTLSARIEALERSADGTGSDESHSPK
jgi:hypothetical protein